MSLNEINLPAITQKQFLYKLKANANLIYSLIIMQLIGLLISLGGVGRMGAGNGQLYISLMNYSANIVIIISFIWVFYIAFLLTTTMFKNMDFTLIGNRISSHFSNIGVLTFVSLFGGLTASLFSVLLRIVIYFLSNRAELVLNGFYPKPSELLLSTVIVILYMFLISGSGYFMGVLAQSNILFVVIIPAAVIGLARLNIGYFNGLITFLFKESSLLLFAVKVIGIVIVLLGLSILISNRMEVRK